jgi:WD40 repeat protein
LRWARLPGAILAAVFVCGGCAVQRVPIGAGPPFLRSAGLARVSDLRAVSPPAWSPDGRHLAFSTADALWSVRPAPGDVDRRRIAPVAGVERVAWSPDGRTLGVLAGGRLLAIGFDDPSPRALAPVEGVRFFAWPPAGRAAVGPVYTTFAGGRTAVWTVRGPERQVRVALLAAGVEARSLAWLAGNTGVAVAAGGRGTDADRIVFLRPDVRTEPRVQMLPAGGRAPVPSPEGRFIAYLEDAGSGEARVAVMRSDGTGRRVLTPAGRYSGLAWSPAGTLVAYARQEGDRAALEIADVLTGARLWLGDYRPEAGPPHAPLAIVWAPDGARLAFGTDTGAAAGFVWVATLERQ